MTLFNLKLNLIVELILVAVYRASKPVFFYIISVHVRFIEEKILSMKVMFRKKSRLIATEMTLCSP